MSSCFTQYCHIQVTITTDNRTQQQYNKYNQIQKQRKWGHNPRLTNWMGYRANRGCRLKQALTRSHSYRRSGSGIAIHKQCHQRFL